MDQERRRNLRELNTRAWHGEKDLFPVNKSLDSSLKKNTALIKRLRTAISPATLNTFLQDIRTLSLHKYLSEIISACYEGLCKVKSPVEIDAAVEIVSALHQRFGPAEFTEYLGWLLGKGMATPDKGALKSLPQDVREKEEKERIIRQRALLRVITELWLLDVLRTLDHVSRPDDMTKVPSGKSTEPKPRGSSSTKSSGTEPYPLEVLKDLLGYDREHVNLPLLVMFVKTFGWDLLGVKPSGSDGRRPQEVGDTGAAPVDDPACGQPFASPELQERFKNVVKKYFDDVTRHLIRDQKALKEQHHRNAETFVKAGEVFEDRLANYDKRLKAQERLVANAQVIADVIGAEMPDLLETDDSNAIANGSIGLVKTEDYLRGSGDGAGIWNDDEERRFYENLVDLKGKVPPILLEDGKKKKPENDEQVGKKVEYSEPDAKAVDGKVQEPNEDQSMAIANKTIGAQVDAVLARLPDMNTKDLVDQIASDFCFLNSKASRNRLIKALTDVPKGRTELLPYWSRLIATLGQYMPDIPKGLIDYLDAEFRSLQKRKEKEFLGQVRLANIRYLAELTKFGIVPDHVVFHCLKVSLDDFSRMNIEILCNLLEHCGRYLFRNPLTSPRMATFLETLRRKKSVLHIGQDETMKIENAVNLVDPPDRPAIEQKERTPMELFIRKLIYGDMTRRNYSKILKQIRRLHWEEPEVVHILRKVFSKPAKVKYGNIHLLAILLSEIYRYHAGFVERVIENLIESISFGLEQSEYRFYQKRLAEVRYLAELYNYRLLEHPVIFDTMYKITLFGYGGPPLPGKINPFDLPDDFFRVRLVSTIIDTCGMFFQKGAAGKKLDYFLSFFQYYIFTKNPLPMEIEFVIQDTFARSRPNWKLAKNLEEAAAVFQSAMAQQQKLTGVDRGPEVDERSTPSSSEDEIADNDLEGDMDGDGDSNSEEEEAEGLDSQHSGRGSDSEEEAIVVTREEEEIDEEDAAEFEREYAKMMAESLESRKHERKPLFDVPLPMRSKNREASETKGSGGEGSSTMAFSLLTKKGNRQQTKTVELPSDSTFATDMRNRQQAEREEQQRIKNLVLNYDLRENDDQDGHERPMSHPVNRNERGGKDRGTQRVRKLQLSDVDWYGILHTPTHGPKSKSAVVT